MGASGPIGAAFAVACRGGSGLSVPLSPAACANSRVLGAPYADGGLCVPKSDELKSRLDASLGVNGRDGSRSDALHDVLSHVCVCVLCVVVRQRGKDIKHRTYESTTKQQLAYLASLSTLATDERLQSSSGSGGTTPTFMLCRAI